MREFAPTSELRVRAAGAERRGVSGGELSATVMSREFPP